jgi:RNA polymerase sigma factor (sigma-70 family)
VAARASFEGDVQRDLVQRAQRGDREAFRLLADASLPRLCNLARLMLADGDVADDAVQEALIVTWRDLRALRDPDRFEAWLNRILIRSVYRVAKHERRHLDRRHLAPLGDGSSLDPVHALEDRDAIDRGFRHLKAEHRAVLVVHHFLGLSDDEAAEVLGVPAGTVKSRLHRATAAMRAELDADTRSGERFATGAVR